MNVVEQMAKYRRGRILMILGESNSEGASEPMIRTMVRGWGYKADADTVAIDLAWVSRQGLATLRMVGEVQFARITQAGRDVISRDLDLPGIAVLED